MEGSVAMETALLMALVLLLALQPGVVVGIVAALVQVAALLVRGVTGIAAGMFRPIGHPSADRRGAAG